MPALTVVLAWFFGQLLLAVTCFTSWRMFHRTPNLTRRLDVVREFVTRSGRVDRARFELDRARVEQARLQAALVRAEQLAADRVSPVNTATHRVWAGTFAVATLILFEADAVLMALLNGTSELFGLSPAAWAFLGSWVAAGVFVLADVLLYALIADERRPGRTLRRAHLGASIAGLVVFLGFWASLSGRGVGDFSQAGWAIDVIQLGLWILTLVLAIGGAFTAVVATSSLTEARIATESATLKTRLEQYRRHIEALEHEIAQHSSTTAPPATSAASNGTAAVATASPTGASSMSRVAAIAMILSFGGISDVIAEPVIHANVGGAGRSSSAESESQAVHRSGQHRTPEAEECEGLVDVSGSISKEVRRRSTEAFAGMLPLMLDAYGCRLFRLSAFSGDAPLQPIEEFTLPPLPTSDPSACPSPEKSAGLGGMADRMYPGLRQRKDREAMARCQERRRKEREHAETARSNVIKEVSAAAVRLADAPARGACTAIYEAAERAVQRSGRVVVVTDGDSTCRRPVSGNGSISSIHQRPSGALLFLLVPGAGSGSREALDRASRLNAVFPDATVHFLNEATPSFWRKVGVVPGTSSAR